MPMDNSAVGEAMQYRRFGRLDWQGSALGFGAMRLPLTDVNQANIDEPEAISMIRYAIDHGVNYLDTAYPYHMGQSERVVGRALRDGYRERMKLATKMPVRMVESASDFNRYFNEQLERLQCNKVDFYLLHGLNGRSWAKVRDLGVLRWAEDKMAKGHFDYLGFSFHDDYEAFKGIVDGYDNWTLCQIQYNYMDINYQAGTEGLKYAAQKGLAVVVMEPLRGGRLTKPPDSVANLWESAAQKRTPAKWGLLWVWNQPEVSLALSGMSTMEQVMENVATAGGSGPGILTADELALIDLVREEYKKLSPIPCTKCGYCLPCPNGVEIPTIFELYNEAVIYNDARTARFRYRGPNGLKEEQRADQCIECEECVDACPQQIPIPEWLKKAHSLLGPRQ
jgi:predicted aldo/keto reductase-like oxidoreductase